jgi:hypothetical protein
MGRSADRSLVHGDSRIEVSNGNGVGGMAGRVTQRLRELNLAVTRISNADRFVYRTTRIFFRESHAAEARALSRMLPVEVELIAFPETQMPARVDVRLVIGGDFVAPAQIEQINPAPPVPLAGAETILRG